MEQKTEASQAVERAILTWQERAAKNPAYWWKSSPIRYMEAEIADLRAALKAQPAPTDPYRLDDDDEARFPNDTDVVIMHKDRYWKLRGCEDVCAALDAKPAPAEAAQGEDSARLDAVDLDTIEEAAKVLESAAKHNEGLGRTVFAHVQGDRAVRLRAILGRARASAETGGVKS